MDLSRFTWAESIFWYENGRLAQREFHQNGEREGKFKCWYWNGNLEISSFWKNGNREGMRKRWDMDGNLTLQEFYRNGILYFRQIEQRGFFRIRRMLRKHIIHPLDAVLISDLAKMCQ